MYLAGMGGEWLCNIVTKESNVFHEFPQSQSRARVNVKTNQHFYQAPKILAQPTLKVVNRCDESTIAKYTFQNLINAGYDVSAEIQHVEKCLERGIPLITKNHVMNHEIFNTPNTFLLVTLNKATLIKHEIIGLIKQLDSTTPMSTYKNHIINGLITAKRGESTGVIEKYQQLLTQIECLNYTRMPVALVFLLYDVFKYVNNDTYLTPIINEKTKNEWLRLFIEHHINNAEEINSMLVSTRELIMPKANKRIVMFIDQFSEPHYLQNIFSLKRDISTDFIEWDQKNIALLRQYGFEY